MDAIQFSLFFAALVIGYLLLHLRVSRFDKLLRELTGLRLLNERVGALVESVDRIRQQGLREQLERMQGDLQRLVEVTAQIERAIPEAVEHAPAVVLPAPGATAGEQIRANVVAHLQGLGFTNVRVLHELARVRFDEDLELQVECERQHMPCKGKVTVQGGTVRDAQVQSAAPMFP